jgi:uncharacterized protein (DUF1697 family)
VNTYIALIRGINVGRANRVSMADLRCVVAGLGYGNVRTLLNSGNVVLDSERVMTAVRRAALAKAVADQVGANVGVIVLSGAELATVVADDPLASVATDPSRYLVAVTSSAADLKQIAALGDLEWAPERLALGSCAAYLWCPDGVRDSPLFKACNRAAGGAVTTRNWATVLKLYSLACSKT